MLKYNQEITNISLWNLAGPYQGPLEIFKVNTDRYGKMDG